MRRRESIALAASTPRSPDPQTENTENDEEGDLDEIEKLIRRNQWNMGQIRCDLDLMRRETFVESPPRPPAVVIPQQQQQALSTKPAALAGILASEPKARRDDEVIKPRALVASPPDKNASETTTQERLQGEMSRKLLRCTDNGEGTTVSACRENIVRGDSTLRRETEPPSVVELLRLTRLVDSQVTASGGTDNGGDRESENPRRVDGLSTGGYPTPCCPQPLSWYLSVQPMDGKRLTPEENSTSSGSSDRNSAIRLDEPLSILLRSRQDDSGCCYGRGRSESKGVAARSRRGARGKSTAKAEEVKGLCEREEYLYRDRAPAVASDLGTEEDWRENDGGGRVTFAAANIRELLVSEDHPCSPKL